MPQSYVSVYVIGAVIVALIVMMSLFFIFKSLRRAKIIGMDKKIITETIKNSALFSIVPSIPIIIGIGIMMQYLGLAIPWIRNTVIGSLQYEMMAMDTAEKAVAALNPNYTQSSMAATALIVMTLSIISGPIFNAVFYKKYQTKLADLQKKNAKLMDTVTGALMGGLMAGMLSSIMVGGIFSIGSPTVYAGGVNNYGEIILITLAASIVIMGLCGVVLLVFKQKWIENYALPLTILGAIAVAYVFVPTFDAKYGAVSQIADIAAALFI